MENSSVPGNVTPPTILSTVHKFISPEALPSHNNVHPFSSSSGASISVLNDIIHSADQITLSLTSQTSTPITNPKLVSLLRQYSAIAHTLYTSEENTRHIISTLRSRAESSNYGEDIPLDRLSLAQWAIARLETWGASVGMEMFKDDSSPGKTSLVFGGKVIVLDIDFSVDQVDATLDVATVKASYAVQNGGSSGSNTQGSVSLDAFLADSIRVFLKEVQKPEAVKNPVEAGRLGKRIVEQLQYLMLLDRLAASKAEGDGNGGIRWFVGVDAVGVMAESFARSEAEVIASSLSTTIAPLDIFLLRSHALPLPYLTSPSISFLIHLSPQAYLTLLRSTPPRPSEPERLAKVDIPYAHLRSFLTSHPRPRGVTLATLVLSASTSFSPISAAPLAIRPAFPLSNNAPPEHVFPHTTAHEWVLDFTENGKYPGVVMAQSRMREIETIIGFASNHDPAPASIGIRMGAFGSGSWVDLLLDSSIAGTALVSPERYSTLYKSPTSAHPPLQLRLTAPEEPGYILERVRVRSMREVWGVLEVVKEQSWLNEILHSCAWSADGLLPPLQVEQDDNADITEADLQAVLDGSLVPRKIPVSMYLPAAQPRVVLTSPERAPVAGRVEVAIACDAGRARGVHVSIDGGGVMGLGADLGDEMLEEACRRGGALGIPGRAWVNSGQMA